MSTNESSDQGSNEPAKQEASRGIYILVWIAAALIVNVIGIFLERAGVLDALFTGNMSIMELLTLGTVIDVVVWIVVWIGIYSMATTIRKSKVMPYILILGTLGVIGSAVATTVELNQFGLDTPPLFYVIHIGMYAAGFVVFWLRFRNTPHW